VRAEALLHLTIHHLEGLTTGDRLLLVDLFDSADTLARLSREKIELFLGKTIRSTLFDPSAARERALRDIEELTRDRFGYTFYWDSTFPPLLREIHDPPFLLFYRGAPPWRALRSADVPSIAVVGTRYPTGAARKHAHELGRRLAESGVPVVSGLAIGIDEAAHRGVVAANGTAVAILGNGIDSVYPRANLALAHRIIECGGALVSEYGPFVTPKRYYFPARNRIIAGCTRGTVVVEAPQRSGALITVDFALENGRDLFVHRSGVTGPNSAGCRSLETDGATVIDSADDILREWRLPTTGRGMVSEPAYR
jgi:DNA processing protein